MYKIYVKSFLGGIKGNVTGSQRIKDKLLFIESYDRSAYAHHFQMP